MSDSESVSPVSDHRRRPRAAKKSGSRVFDVPSTAENTPAKRKRGRPPGSGKKAQETPNGSAVKPLSTTGGKGKLLFPADKAVETPEGRRQSSRNARKRLPSRDKAIDSSTRDDSLNQTIDEDDLDDSRSTSVKGSDDETPVRSVASPAKSARKRRQQRSSTPEELPPHEQYFWHNRPGRSKPSTNTFPLPLLTHEQYHDWLVSFEDPHAEACENLHQIHTHSFPQWEYELSQQFNVCLYGYGSKRRLLSDFAQHLHEYSAFDPKILIINGYHQSPNMRHVFQTLASLVYDCDISNLPSGLGTQPRDILATILSRLTTHPPEDPIYVFVNSLDAIALRRPPYPSLFAHLAAHQSIHLLATCDTPNFPLLWDVALREEYSWQFHDTTTFKSFAGVEIPSVVDDVNELLGRSGRSIKGKGGAAFVLKSLPENARNLYRILLMEILSASDEGIGSVVDIEENALSSKASMVLGGIERKTLYQKAVEDFVCSNEMGFGQLLNEFYDHDMLIERKEIGGSKVLGVPWRRDECEEILEEIVE